MERMDDASSLPVAQASLRPAEQLSAVSVQLVEFARAVAAVNIFGGDLNAPRRGDAGDGFLKVQIVVIDLDTIVAAISDINQVLLHIHGDAMHRVELILAGTACSHGFNPGTVLCDLDDARVV